MKNIALNQSPNHCTLNKLQHQRHVLVCHSSTASYSGKKYCFAIANLGQMFS